MIYRISGWKRTMRSTAFLTLIGLSLPLPCAFAQQPAAPTLPVAKKTEPIVSFDLKHPKLSDIVTLLGQKYHVNIVTDAYVIDPAGDGVDSVVLKDVPMSKALPQLAMLFHRDMEVIYNVIVWRHPQWYVPLQYEQFEAAHGRPVWQNAGKAQARREQLPTVGSKPLVPPGKPDADAVSDDDLPARLITLEVEESSAHDVARVLSSTSAWGVSVDQDSEDRRVNMQLHSVTPAQAAELLTLVLNARQRIVIGQSEAQKRLAAKGMKDYINPRSVRDKQSDAIKAELRKAMTKEQQDKLANNERVNFNLKDLPASLQKQAMDYISGCIEDIRKSGIDLPDFDLSRGYQLVVGPAIFGPGIGVIAYTADGMLYGF